jgi:peptide/nickel transport system permease protein
MVSAPLVLVAVAVVIYGGLRILRPDLYPPGDPFFGGVLHDLDRGLLHLDFGCSPPGCTSNRELWQRGAAGDIWLLAGGLLVGVGGGVLAGLWCAGHPRALVARGLVAASAIGYCAPVYVVGLLLLYFFNPIFGHVHIPFFFDADPHWDSPWTNPWMWLRTYLVPWLVLAAPLAGMCLRLTVVAAREVSHEDYVRTAVAKGLGGRHVVRRHIGPPSFGTTVSFASVSVPLFVTNLMLVEKVFAVPGFFHLLWKAIGHNAESDVNLPLIIAGALWAAVLVIVLGLVGDAVLGRLDPRVRSAAF